LKSKFRASRTTGTLFAWRLGLETWAASVARSGPQATRRTVRHREEHRLLDVNRSVEVVMLLTLGVSVGGVSESVREADAANRVDLGAGNFHGEKVSKKSAAVNVFFLFSKKKILAPLLFSAKLPT